MNDVNDTTEKKTAPCKTVLVSDHPVKKDELNGAHEKIARAIVGLIDDEGGISISVEGGYGTGKSTVINILKEAIKPSKGQEGGDRVDSDLINKPVEGGDAAGKTAGTGNVETTQIIIFDVWALEGDPLRRSFLERSIRHLIDCKWITGEREGAWKDKIEELAQRKESRTTETTSEVTTIGKWILASLLFVPIGLALLNAALRESVITIFEFSANIKWKFLFGIVLMLFPLIIVLIAVGYRYFFEKGTELTSLWAVLQNKVSSPKEVVKTIKTANPTAIEFEDYFEDLMSETLSRTDRRVITRRRNEERRIDDGGIKEGQVEKRIKVRRRTEERRIKDRRTRSRRIVFVFDNMDRVDPEVALDTWSTLQTFVGQTYSNNLSWASKTWVIVLFDPDVMKKHLEGDLTENSPQEAPDPEDENQVPEKISAKNNKWTSFDGFLEKTFQIRFHVPPPLLSRWKDRLIRLLSDAFPDHKNKDIPRAREFYNVYRIFEIFYSSRGTVPTIRKLKIFVNQIGVVHRQWEDDFPLSHVAYFVLFRERINRELLEHRIGDDYLNVFEQPEQIIDDLMAMSFNIEKAIANEVVLAPKIKQALLGVGETKLEDLAKQPGSFWPVTETLFSDRKKWSDLSNSLGAVAAAFHRSGLLVKKSSLPEIELTVSNIRNWIYFRADKKTAWTPFDENTADGIIGIVSWSGKKPAEYENIYKAILQGLVDNDYNPVNFDMSLLITGLKSIANSFSSNNEGKEHFLSVINSQIKGRLSLRYVEGTPKLKPFAPVGAELEALLRIDSEPELRSKPAEETVTSPPDANPYIYFLNYTFNKEVAGSQLPDYSPESALKVIALCMLRIFEKKGMYDRIATKSSDNELVVLDRILLMNAEEETDQGRFSLIPGAFVKVLSEYNKESILFDILDIPFTNLFVAPSLVSLIESGQTGVFSKEILTKHAKFFLEKMDGPAMTSLFSKMEPPVTEKIDGLLASDFIPEESGFYRLILFRNLLTDGTSSAAEGTQLSPFLDWCRNGLYRITAEEWEKAIKEGSPVFDLIQQMSRDSRIGYTAQPNYIQGAEGLVDKLFSDYENVSPRVGAWGSSSLITGPMDKTSKDEFRRKLWDLALQQGDKVDENVVRDILTNELTDLEHLDQEKPLIQAIFSPYLKKGGPYLEWLVKIVKNTTLEVLEKYGYSDLEAEMEAAAASFTNPADQSNVDILRAALTKNFDG